MIQRLLPLHGGHFCQYSKCSHFSNIIFLSEGFFAYNKYNVLIDAILICFRQFYFLTQSYDFARGIACAWGPSLPKFKMVSFLEY